MNHAERIQQAPDSAHRLNLQNALRELNDNSLAQKSFQSKELWVKSYVVAFDFHCLIIMDFSSTLQHLAVICAILGGTVLGAGVIALNGVMGQRSRKDKRVLIDKVFGTYDDNVKAREEAWKMIPCYWRENRVIRVIVYAGIVLLVMALCAMITSHLIGPNEIDGALP